jgi:hypothetical protein
MNIDINFYGLQVEVEFCFVENDPEMGAEIEITGAWCTSWCDELNEPKEVCLSELFEELDAWDKLEEAVLKQLKENALTHEEP